MVSANSVARTTGRRGMGLLSAVVLSHHVRLYRVDGMFVYEHAPGACWRHADHVHRKPPEAANRADDLLPTPQHKPQRGSIPTRLVVERVINLRLRRRLRGSLLRGNRWRWCRGLRRKRWCRAMWRCGGSLLQAGSELRFPIRFGNAHKLSLVLTSFGACELVQAVLNGGGC